MSGGEPLNATKMANYRQRLREELEQENALKYLKKKKKKQDQLRTEEMEEKTGWQKSGRVCGQSGKNSKRILDPT